VTRFSSAPNAAAVALRHVDYVLFVDFDFASGHIRLNTSGSALTFGSNTYAGLDTKAVVGIGPVKESADLSADKLEFTLANVPTTTMADTLTQVYHGRSASLYIGYLQNAVLVDTPHLLWEGRMDRLLVRSEEGGSSISLICENRLVLWGRASGWMYTDEHQREFSAFDAFFDQVASLPNKVARWGEETVASGNNNGYPRFGRRNRVEP
jgi:hypothetical protein